jgi:hypothetical protein
MEFNKLSNASNNLIKIAAVVAAISAIAGGYSFYLNNIWIPSVKINSVDYAKGIANISYKNVIGRTQNVIIYGDTTFILQGQWGIAFGTTITEKGSEYDRLEILKNGMVYNYVIKK